MRTIEKPWGKEEILVVQDKYMVKRLHMNPGAKCSLQYHEYKTETIYVLNGVLLLHIYGQIITMYQGDCRTILPRVDHRMECGHSSESVIFLECSTPEMDDVIRIEDDYGRE